MKSQPRSRHELEQALQDQMSALSASCNGYDGGDLWEGPRIATTIYNLVNDGRSKKIVSVLTQLGLRNKISFVSYASPQISGNVLSWHPLCAINMNASTATYVPYLGDAPTKPTKIKFNKWWEEAVFENRSGQTLSRMNLVFALRSKDGGSHYDAELPISPYLELKETGGGWMYSENGSVQSGKPIRNAHLATIRQIAYELQLTLSVIL
ncbi:hypothetical protein WNY59_00405 [Ahrensia kielensis]|uniref:Uncharacterized protein n=1 Tax=Ahrensia kielensis TaxID=76980 RepID=A0ABU9T1N3_9HYPH